MANERLKCQNRLRSEMPVLGGFSLGQPQAFGQTKTKPAADTQEVPSVLTVKMLIQLAHKNQSDNIV